MSYRIILTVLLAAAGWCALPTSAAAQKVGAYYRNPYTGSFSYGTYQYNPYTGRNTYGDPYNPWVGPYAVELAYYNTYYYNAYPNTYLPTPPAYPRYRSIYFSHYGYDRR